MIFSVFSPISNLQWCKMGQPSDGGLPFNSFIGNVALKSLLRRPPGVPL